MLGVVAATLAAGLVAATAQPTAALTTYEEKSGTTALFSWPVNDSYRPGLDTGSIRNIPRTGAEALGSLFVEVDGATDRMNGQMMRGFGLVQSGASNFVSTNSVRLGEVLLTRELRITAGGVATYLDTFTNAGTAEASVTSSFGGSLGLGDPTPRDGAVFGQATAALPAASSDDDPVFEAGDEWIVAKYSWTKDRVNQAGTPADTSDDTRTRSNARSAVGLVVGDTDGLVDQQARFPLDTPYQATGSRSNNPGFVNELSIPAGQTRSLLRSIVVGAAPAALPSTSASSDFAATDAAADAAAQQQIDAEAGVLADKAGALAAAPVVTGFTVDELCTVANFPLTALGLGDSAEAASATCAGAAPLRRPAALPAPTATTTVAYDVTGKTIQDLKADLASGAVSAVEITKAYLDRIEAYDQGSLGFKSFITVAKNAVAQALEADKRIARGETGELLGIPVALKDLYITKDMPTSGGTKALEGFQSSRDAWQVAKLREAGAIIIGKTNLSEFANSGSFSESGFMQTWNALYPSKTSFGSSGGSATAVAADLAPVAMGTQTGVSLYAPSTGASLYTFRGTDGLSSTAGVMPLTWATDFAGPIAKSIPDLVSMLNATATRTTGNDPADPITRRVDNADRPESFDAGLDPDALVGKKIGYLASSFTPKNVIDDTTGPEALKALRDAVEAAGGELVEIAASAPSTVSGGYVLPGTNKDDPSDDEPHTLTSGGSTSAEGWWEFIDYDPAFPYDTPGELKGSFENLPYNANAAAINATAKRYSAEDMEALLYRRDLNKVVWDEWVDAQGVDAVAYPGFLSFVGNNDAAGAGFSSDRAHGVTTQSFGLPTVMLPIGENSLGYSNNVQIVGKSWSDVETLSYGYAIDQEAQGQMHTDFAPPLPVVAGDYPASVPSTLGLQLDSTSVTAGAGTAARITVAADLAPTGTVEVSVGGRTLTAPLANGTATVTLPHDLPLGGHLVTARYAGNGKVSASAATASLVVRYAQPSVAVKPKKKTVTMRQRARLRITVTGSAALPTATAIVYDGRRALTSVKVDADGTTTAKLPRLAKGKHRLSVYYTGGGVFEPAISPGVVVKVKR